MTPLRRWGLVALGTLLLVATPFVLHALPAAQSDVSATALFDRVEVSDDRGWSGYVVSDGTLQLPDSGNFSDVSALFGGRTTMRAWWQDADHWRVDQLLVSGETDLVHAGEQTTEWDYERARASVSNDPGIRLPRTADLVPPALARRLLHGATAAELSRIPAVRVAGTSAPGLRLTPASPLSSIDHADLWADPGSGVPLRVEVFASAHGAAAFTTSFRDFSAKRPGDDAVSFTPTPSSEVRFDDILDIADAANQYAPFAPPATVAGLTQSASSDGAVGVYGTGPTQVIAIPLRDREADALRDQLLVTPGVTQVAQGSVVSVGPLGVMITGQPGDGAWLLAGTLTRAGLEQAAADVLAGFRPRRSLR